MNRTEAKAYALNELGLDRYTVRQFGNLSRTQTWLDAIAAQASGGIASQEALAANEAMIVAETSIAQEPVALDTSFETFWDSAPALLQPQPLVNVSALDEDWDDLQAQTPASDEVILYPLVIVLLMLWAILQLLLLVTGWVVTGLTAFANYLDDAATRRLEAVSRPPNRQLIGNDSTAWMPASS